MRHLPIAAALGLGLLCGTTAMAGPIVGAIDVTTDASSFPAETDAGPNDWDISNLISQDSLSASYESGVSDFEEYMAEGATDDDAPGSAFGTFAPEASLTFELSSAQVIDGLVLWNRGQSEQGIRAFTVTTATSDDFSDAEVVGQFETMMPDGEGAAAAQIFRFDPASALFVRLDVTSNWGLATMANEVAFRRADGRPEWASTAFIVMLLLGLGYSTLRFFLPKY